MQLPTYVQVEPVGQCNLRCEMCSIQFRQDGPPNGPPAFMDFDTYTGIIDQFDDLKDLHLQGLGEPMMHPRYFDMVAYAAGKGIKVTTNSNLTLLNPRRAERCVTSGLQCLHVSIDGSTAETYERIRVRAHFDRVLRNVDLLLNTRERLGSELPVLKMVMVIMRRNLHELPDLVRLAHRFKMETLFVQHLCHDFGESSLPSHYKPMRDFVEEETLLNEDPERIERYFGEAREVAETLGVNLRLPRTQPRPHPVGTPGRKRCSWPWTGAYFSYQGYSMPCCMVSTPDRINFGKARAPGNGQGGADEHTVREIWSGEAYHAFRDQLDSEQPPEICKSCAVYNGTF
jgi:MoaA/NifB/PqqE/SkfB family radical SAM enzyme